MAPKSRAEYQDILAAEFLTCLAQKGLAWKKGWDAVSMAPQNAVTNRPYRGVNRFYLGLLALTRGYTDPRWATMTQIKDIKGIYHPGQKWHLQKGSKAVYVQFWQPWDPVQHKPVPWEDYRRLTPEEQDQYQLRVQYTPVFHASMIDGLPPVQIPPREPQRLDDIVSRLSQGMKVELLFDGGGQAFYRPSEDKIHLPAREAFKSEYELNATALHELAHATGHPNRLNRPQTGRFGTKEYAYEELVAEISSCFMGINLDTEQTPAHVENHKAYVQSWIAEIANKRETLTDAIQDAQRAAEYMSYYAGLELEPEQAKEGQKAAPAQEGPAPRRAVQPGQERPWSPVTRSGKLHFTDEQYRAARSASALEYARRQGYSLVREGSRYHLAEHDSMIFLPNGQWHWNSRDLHGGAIEFLTQYEGKSLPEAVLTLAGVEHDRAAPQQPQPAAPYAPAREDLENRKAEFVLPPRAGRMNRLFSYLCSTRGLDYELVRTLVKADRVYEGLKRMPDGAELHNAVFVGLDAQGVPRSAFQRGCAQGSSFKAEQPGSDKTWPFLIPGRPDSRALYVFEAAIDAASHATVCKLAGVDWQAAHRAALGGNAPKEAVLNVLAQYPGIRTVVLCMDSDNAGRAIAEKLQQHLEAQGVSLRFVRKEVPLGKDWNEYLQAWRGVVARHEQLPTTELADGTAGEVCGRLHFLDPQGGVARTVAYTDPKHFANAAAQALRRGAPCAAETPAQLEELRRLAERRAAAQAKTETARQAEEVLDRVRADGEPDMDKEMSREHRGFRDSAPEAGQRMSMAEQLANAAQEAGVRNAAHSQAAVRQTIEGVRA